MQTTSPAIENLKSAIKSAQKQAKEAKKEGQFTLSKRDLDSPGLALLAMNFHALWLKTWLAFIR